MLTLAPGKSPVRLALVCSSGGGVLDGLCAVTCNGQWPIEIVGVVTDRACGAERIAARREIPCRRIEAPPTTWSESAAETLVEWRPDIVLLLILRKVEPVIWQDLNCNVWNLHPSLLPNYPGLQALERNFSDAINAHERGQTIPLGVTLHDVNDTIDGGPVLRQGFFTVSDAPTLDRAGHLSYLLKIGLVLEELGTSLPGVESLTSAELSALAQPWAKPWCQCMYGTHAFGQRVVTP